MMSQVRWTFSLLRGGNQRSWFWSRSWSWSWFRSSSLFTDSSSPGLVLQSRSTDVHQNLALEDWIDANVDLQRRGVLLLWRNRLAVVIGRHQNPWAECDLRAMRKAGVALARRRSGGGTVFHDLGNLNLTFFASKKAYDRRRNLKVVTEALRNLRPELDVRATERLDIVLDGRYKISEFCSGSPTVLVDPSDESVFPGIGRLEAELRGWNWTFGKTPKFSVEMSLRLEEVLGSVQLQVKDGRISSCRIQVPPGWVPQQLVGELENILVGEKFCPNAATAAAAALLRSENRPIRELCAALLQVMG